MPETIKIESNHVILLSENENSDTADAKFIICDFSPNGNNVSINRKTIESWLDTLVNKPFVGKVITRFDGKEDFSGHNVKIVEETDDDGNKYKTVEFDTQAFGTFYEVSIETIDGVEYITARAKIWKRFKKAYNVFKKRVASKKGLKTSWEINVSESHIETIKNKKVKVIDSGEFIGHCALGENVAPAYKSSGVIEVASLDEDNELIEALSSDVLALSEVNKENDSDKENIQNNHEISKGGCNLKVEDKNQVSALTENDIYRKVRKAINNSSEDKYYYISVIYPYEYRAIAYVWDREKDSDFIEFTYTVNSDDTVSITGRKDVEMVFVPKSKVDSQVAKLQEELEEAEKQIAEAGKLLTQTQKEKEELEERIAELSAYKEKVEELEKEAREKELAEKKEQLKAFALEDGLISAEELESDEKLAKIFSELTIEGFESAQEKIEVIKGRKAIQKFREEKELSNKQGDNEKDLETSENKENEQPKSNLSDNDELLISSVDIIKNYISKK